MVFANAVLVLRVGGVKDECSVGVRCGNSIAEVSDAVEIRESVAASVAACGAEWEEEEEVVDEAGGRTELARAKLAGAGAEFAADACGAE